MSNLHNKVAVVTGAGHPKGIGRAIVERLKASGARVLAVDLAMIGKSGIDVMTCDITNADDISALTDSITKQFGRVDILVNNAGVGLGSAQFQQCSSDDWQTTLDVNIMGAVRLCKALLPLFPETGGSIVNIASLAGLGALPAMPAPYTVSKFALVGLTKSLALELAPKQIRVNAICPGSIKTQLHDVSLDLIAESEGVDRKTASELEIASIPMGYSADAAEVAGLAEFLCSDSAKYMTGVALPVSGGMASGL